MAHPGDGALPSPEHGARLRLPISGSTRDRERDGDAFDQATARYQGNANTVSWPPSDV